MRLAIAIWVVTLAVGVAALLWFLRSPKQRRTASNVTDLPPTPTQVVEPTDAPVDVLAGSSDIMEADKAFGYNRWGLLSAIWFWALLAAPFGYLCRTGYWSADRWMCRSHAFDFALIVPYGFSTALMAYWMRRAFVEGKRKEFRSMLRTLVIHSFWGVMYVWAVF